MTKKIKEFCFQYGMWILFGIYLAILFRLTLISRIGTNHRAFLPPFWSVKEALGGYMRPLLWDAENIALFVPLGFFLRHQLRLRDRWTLLCGMLLSLTIETCQWLFYLGDFEIDDLIDNSLGTLLGLLIAKTVLRLLQSESRQAPVTKRKIVAMCVAFLLAVLMPFAAIAIKTQHIHTLTVGENGEQNLITYDYKNGTVGDTQVYVSYKWDGTIHIKGHSDERAWKRVATVELQPGTYHFEGLSGVETGTVAIEMEYIGTEDQQYHRLTPEVGPADSAEFTIEKELTAYVYIGIYPDATIDVYARPVLWKIK